RNLPFPIIQLELVQHGVEARIPMQAVEQRIDFDKNHRLSFETIRLLEGFERKASLATVGMYLGNGVGSSPLTRFFLQRGERRVRLGLLTELPINKRQPHLLAVLISF